ncbi:MAG: cysteine desulfurase [Parachlamydiaceae bacterium]|nr:cysteine desulfurase [Parachlamydiaceae bacterium]
MKHKIYLDNNAATALDPRVYSAVIDCLAKDYGNPSSLHSFGRESRALITRARHTIAQYFQFKPQEVVFTSSGTEALNMVIRGMCSGSGKGHIITSDVEHAAVYTTVKLMEIQGCSATYLSPGLLGAVTPDVVKAAIRSDTRLIALMAVNNETGVKTDIAAIAAIALEAKIPFLVDGIALLGKDPFTIPSGVSAICFSGYKIHAPKGIGLALVRSSLKLQPLISGGEQEFGRRGGTENVPGIVGFAEAIRILTEVLPAASDRMLALRNQFEEGLARVIPGMIVNGTGPRVSNTSNIAFPGVDGEALLTALDIEGIAASHGSACASGALEPSRILLNMGVPVEVVNASIRFSISRMTTSEEIQRAVEIIAKLVQKNTRIV